MTRYLHVSIRLHKHTILFYVCSIASHTSVVSSGRAMHWRRRVLLSVRGEVCRLIYNVINPLSVPVDGRVA